jgi:hypothetical protein
MIKIVSMWRWTLSIRPSERTAAVICKFSGLSIHLRRPNHREDR